MSRSRAFLYHLGGTLVLLGLLTLAIRMVWFPEPYGEGLGLQRRLLLLWLLVLGAGPLLTLVLFRPGKPGLKFDLGIVALLQAAALAVSTWMVFQARPVFAVFAVDRFEVVQPGEVRFDGEVTPEFAALPFAGPRFVVAEMPTDPEEKSDLLFLSLETGVDLHNLARYYRPYAAPHVETVLRRAKPLAPLLEQDASARREVLERLDPDLRPEALSYVPVMTREAEMIAVLRPADGRVLAVVPVTPE